MILALARVLQALYSLTVPVSYLELIINEYLAITIDNK
jgi:hypothetical protein